MLPNDSDACYAYPSNKERNGITEGIFSFLVALSKMVPSTLRPRIVLSGRYWRIIW